MKRDDSDNKIIRAAQLWNRIVERESKEPVERLRNLPLASNSALHARLLEGIPPLRHRPPKRGGDPWYEVIETENVFTVSVQNPDAHFIGEDPAIHQKEILIEGEAWEIISTITKDQEYIVSWSKYPLEWKLWRDWQKSSSLDARSVELRETYGEWYIRALGPEAAEAKLQDETRALEHAIRTSPDQRIDEDGEIWSSEWRLKLVMMPGWTWTGKVTEVGRYLDLVSVCEDGKGDLALYSLGSGESWVRIDYCYYHGTGRFVSVSGLSLAGLTLAVQNFEAFLRSVMDMPMSTFKVMDRERDGIVTRKYMVPAAALPWRR